MYKIPPRLSDCVWCLTSCVFSWFQLNWCNVPFSLTYDCMQLSGEVYQYAVIPRGIAACNRDFTLYQKKLLKPNPGKPRQITSYPKKLLPYFDFFNWFLNYPMATSPNNGISNIFISFNYINLFHTSKYSNSTAVLLQFALVAGDVFLSVLVRHMPWYAHTSSNNCRAAIKSLRQ